MTEIVDRLVAAIGPDRIETGATVTSIAKTGPRWRVDVAGSDPIAADQVLVAAAPRAAAEILASAHPELACEIGKVRSLAIATVILTFDAGDRTRACGDLMITRTEGRSTSCATVVSAKWPDRTPAGRIVIRAIVGGDRSPDLVEQGDDAVCAAVIADLGAYWHLPEPRSSRVIRFGRSAPSPPPGHRTRIAEIAARASAIGGIHLAGGAYAMGLGFSSCVEQARRTARAIFARG